MPPFGPLKIFFPLPHTTLENLGPLHKQMAPSPGKRDNSLEMNKFQHYFCD